MKNSLTKTTVVIFLALNGLISNRSFAQNVYIPDSNFKAALLTNTLINTNGNSEIECVEADTFRGIFDVFNSSITDLTRIEYFISINKQQTFFIKVEPGKHYKNGQELKSLKVF